MVHQHVKMLILPCLLIISATYGSADSQFVYDKMKYQVEVQKWLNKVEPTLGEFKALINRLNWNEVTGDYDEKSAKQLKKLMEVKNLWKNKICEADFKFEFLTEEQERKIHLFCRGAKFTDDILFRYSKLMRTLLEEYQDPVCLPQTSPLKNQDMSDDFPKPGQCVNGEPDLEIFMRNTNHSVEELKYIWTLWHNFVGPRIKNDFYMGVMLQNIAAKKNGYNDMGEVWREELEIPDLETYVENLYKEIEPFYVALHAVVRHKLYKKHGKLIIDLKGPIPIHLLGNMWGQDWSSLIDLFTTEKQKINLDERIKKGHPNERTLVLEGEDFYTSLGFPKLPQQFWKHSIFEKINSTTVCHGSAADLYYGDYRMVMCGEVSMDTLHVIHHEMGHIYYFMAFENQDPIFKDGSNSAIHESIGDAIMHGVMTPQHLHRIGALNDDELYDPDVETLLLFKQALNKIPELPFALALDKYRWDVFKGAISYDDLNGAFWKLTLKYRGVVAPEERGEEYFDAGAKFHVPDNTPYIRYFLSGIIQMDIFKSLCELSLFNKTNYLNEENIPLHRCDIYGSKDSGKRLWSMMERGAGIHWSEAMKIITGKDKISSKPVLEYYKPVYTWLLDYIEKNNVYIGW
ncbi:unnamed protein product [Brassicogethes aeneus]|uniref:Angiotensin-converting enzyme n=1 Tax=Brassicogethes aeneus TaxID=1431903 RepID=A0A9P0AWU5_BRAAE|nr:unnamed protein product [Brassicogethes aeneus]